MDSTSQASPVEPVGETRARAWDDGARQWPAACIAGVIGVVVTSLGSWHPSLWSDEAATISAATRPLPDLWNMLRSIDLVHGFYYLLMHGWISVFGDSAFALRFPSALAIGMASASVYIIGYRLGGRTFAIVGVPIFVLLPRVFWAGGEGRSYALTAAVAAAATAVLLTVVDRNGRRGRSLWVAYGLLMVVGVLANLYVVLLFVAHGTSVLWDRRIPRSTRRSWLVAAAFAGATCLPFLFAAYRQAGQLSDRSFGIKNLLQNVAVNQWFLGDTPTTTTGAGRTSFALSNSASWWIPAALLLATVAWGLMALAVVDDRHGWLAPDQATGFRSATVWLIPWILVPTVVIGAYSVAITPMYGPRYLTFAAPAVALLMGRGVLAFRKPRWRITVMAVLAIAALPVIVSQRQLYAKNSSDWVSVAQYLDGNTEVGQGVYFTPRYDVDSATVGQTTRGISVAYPQAFSGLRDVTLIESPVAAGNLVGRSRYLDQSTAELADLDTLWMVRRSDYPKDELAADERTLAEAGFRQVTSWEGPLDVVSRFDRSG